MLFSGPLAQWHPLRKWGLGLIAGTSMLIAPGVAGARGPEPSQAPVALSQLPSEAQSVHRQIRQGGPFAHAKDGTVFGNRERNLPSRPRGFYREYTVSTPGTRDRGARRIVCGGARPAAPEACFYTADHYSSFRRITP